VLVAAALAGTLVALAGSIALLQRREARQDAREKLLTAHAFL
jgi:hypothetical protein